MISFSTTWPFWAFGLAFRPAKTPAAVVASQPEVIASRSTRPAPTESAGTYSTVADPTSQSNPPMKTRAPNRDHHSRSASVIVRPRSATSTIRDAAITINSAGVPSRAARSGRPESEHVFSRFSTRVSKTPPVAPAKNAQKTNFAFTADDRFSARANKAMRIPNITACATTFGQPSRPRFDIALSMIHSRIASKPSGLLAVTGADRDGPGRWSRPTR